MGGFYSLCREAVGVFYSPSRLGYWTLIEGVLPLCKDAVGVLYIDLQPGQTCHSKDGGSCIFHWRGRAWLIIWDRVKIPRYSHKLMHRKRVTCKLHNSYFRSMMIKTCPSKDGGSGYSFGHLWEEIERTLNYYITQCTGNSRSFGDQRVGEMML